MLKATVVSSYHCLDSSADGNPNADFNKIKGDWIDEWSVTIVKEKAYQFKKTIGLRINNNKSGG